MYRVWETIWSAQNVVTEHFVVFMALAMVRYYRDIIIENNMDFTDTIKFFNGELMSSRGLSIEATEFPYQTLTPERDSNLSTVTEMAERHDAKRITALARECVVELQSLIRA